MGAEIFIYILAGLGGLILAYLICSLMWTLIGLLLPRKDLLYEYRTGSWAVITGASDGIGLSFAKQLAKQGFHICLIARNPQKLAKVEMEIKSLNPDIETKIVIADFQEGQTIGFFQKIVDELKYLNIGILINNVGIMVSGKFEQIAVQRLIQQVNVNVLSQCCLTNLLLPVMLRRDERSAIINVSSTAAQVPTPYTANYSGTKAYNKMLSRAIELEFKQKIDVLCVEPNWVQSNLSNLSTRRPDVVTADQCAKACLDHLGYDNLTMGHWKHRLFGFVIRWAPQFIVNRMAKSMAIDTHKERDRAV